MMLRVNIALFLAGISFAGVIPFGMVELVFVLAARHGHEATLLGFPLVFVGMLGVLTCVYVFAVLNTAAWICTSTNLLDRVDAVVTTIGHWHRAHA